MARTPAIGNLDFHVVPCRGAVLSDCATYRYALWRVWNQDLPKVLFIGLNPSTADAENDDPTVRRCVGFARSWGFGGVVIGNLFAFRSTCPKSLGSVSDPVGLANDGWLRYLHKNTQMAIAAWGAFDIGAQQASRVLSQLRPLHCIGRTKQGMPRHPLYAPGSLCPEIYQPSDASC